MKNLFLENLNNYPKIYRNNCIDIYDLSECVPGTVYLNWKGFNKVSEKILTQALDRSSEYIQSRNIKVFISDFSRLNAISRDVMDWMCDNWNKEVQRKGLVGEITLNQSENETIEREINNFLERRDMEDIINIRAENLHSAVNMAQKIFQNTEKPEPQSIRNLSQGEQAMR